jgi:hypothetical protein
MGNAPPVTPDPNGFPHRRRDPGCAGVGALGQQLGNERSISGRNLASRGAQDIEGRRSLLVVQGHGAFLLGIIPVFAR